MGKFIKKPIPIEAEQFFKDQPLPFRDRGPFVCNDYGGFYVTTAHNQRVNLSDGDWVVPERVGEFKAYPITEEIFKATYDPVEGAESDKLKEIDAELRQQLKDKNPSYDKIMDLIIERGKLADRGLVDSK